MTDVTQHLKRWLDQWADEPYAYLTTVGRRTGRPHRIEIWFGALDGRMYLMSGGRDRSDWVRNLMATPRVTVELGDETHTGMARVLAEGSPADQRARDMLVQKYATSANPLDDWKRRSLAILIEFSSDDPAVSANQDG